MVNFETPVENNKIMKCEHSDKTAEELEKERWECVYSFHVNIPEQWNMACEKVDEAKGLIGDWEIVLIRGKNESERMDGVHYLYRKKTEQR